MLNKSLVAPYIRDGKTVAAYDNHRRPAPKRAAPVDLFHAGGDPELDKLEALSKRTVRIASGLSRVNDFTPAAHAGHGVGVEAGELSATATDHLAHAVLNWKAQLFVDSGAFGAFMSAVKADRKPEPMDYEREVFPAYDRLLDRIDELNDAEEPHPAPLLVMPDVVGDQLASLDLVARYRPYVRATIDFPGVSRAIIPIQRGPLSMAEAYRKLVEILGTDDFIVGVPSNAAAITPEEFRAFLAEAKPRGVHILGALHDSRLRPRLAQIIESGHDPAWVSADANPLRSQIVEHGQTKDERQARIADRLGERARADELDAWLEHNGGEDGLRAAYEAADGERKFRMMGLLKDLTGLATDQVAARYHLSYPPFRTGWTLDAHDRGALLERIPPAYGKVVAHHVTFKFGGGSSAPAADAAGQVVGIADDGQGVQALVVSVDGTTTRPDGGIYHVTWSLAPGRKPVESNAVIKKHGFKPLAEPIPLRLLAPQ